ALAGPPLRTELGVKNLPVAEAVAPPRGEEGTAAIELLDAVVARIGDVDVPAPVGCHALGGAEFAVTRARNAPRQKERTRRDRGRGRRRANRGRAGGAADRGGGGHAGIWCAGELKQQETTAEQAALAETLDAALVEGSPRCALRTAGRRRCRRRRARKTGAGARTHVHTACGGALAGRQNLTVE